MVEVQSQQKYTSLKQISLGVLTLWLSSSDGLIIYNSAVVLEVLCFLSSVNLAVNDQLVYFKICGLLGLLGVLQNWVKFLMNFVYFFWKIVRNSDRRAFKIFNERPYKFFVLVKAELRNYWSRFGRWLACDYSVNALEVNTLHVFFWYFHFISKHITD